MSTIIIFDPTGTPNKVLEVLPNANPSDFVGRSDFIVDPNLASVKSVSMRYWKHVAGTIVEMTDAEKSGATVSSAHSGGKGILDANSSEGIIFRALADVIKDEINILRAAVSPSLPARTLAQLRTTIKNRIDSGSIDL